MNSLRLVQLIHPSRGRFVARVDEPKLTVLVKHKTIYDLALAAISSGKKIADLVREDAVGESLDYDVIYASRGEFALLRPFDHPQSEHRCFVTGTGLTHKASAQNRQSMHETGTISDSMKMYRIGLDGGRPDAGKIGAEPEWFYKGTQSCLRSPGNALVVPAYGDDGGEEGEIAGAYLVGPDATVYRVGLMQGNEFSDHVLESKNYLYLASSKLRSCSIGPELVIDADFSDVAGQSWIERGGKKIWESDLHSGEKWMSHSLANLEHHHFKHASHRNAGDVHIHFFGADNFSYRDKLRLEDGDQMTVAYQNFGRPLRNPIRIDRAEPPLITVKSL